MKMVKFNFEKIEKICEYQPSHVMAHFYWLAHLKIPSEVIPRRTTFTRKRIKGPSFLHNLKEVLLQDVGMGYKYQYIRLASMRNYFDYKVRNIDYLPCIVAEADGQERYLENPLLNINDNNIHFNYEQIEQE